MDGKACIGVERSKKLESFGWAMHHGCGDGVIEHHHGILGHAFEELVQRQDLRPVGILDSDGFVMNSGDGGL